MNSGISEFIVYYSFCAGNIIIGKKHDVVYLYKFFESMYVQRRADMIITSMELWYSKRSYIAVHHLLGKYSTTVQLPVNCNVYKTTINQYCHEQNNLC